MLHFCYNGILAFYVTLDSESFKLPLPESELEG